MTQRVLHLQAFFSFVNFFFHSLFLFRETVSWSCPDRTRTCDLPQLPRVMELHVCITAPSYGLLTNNIYYEMGH